MAEIALVILLPKPPPVYSLITTTSLGSMMQPARQGRDGLRSALRRAVHVHLAVLPVRHRGASFQRLVAGVGRHESLVQNQVRVLEPRFPIAE